MRTDYREICARSGGLIFKSLLFTCLVSISSLARSDQQAAPGKNTSGQQPVIVVLHRSASRDTAKDAANIEEVIQQYVDPARDTVHHRFENVLSGFAGTLSAGAVSALAADSRVDHIEIDNHSVALQADADYSVQSPVINWNLDRIDQTDNSLDGAYHYRNDGTGVNAYIVDTGIRPTHSEFGGRVVGGVSLIPGEISWEDCRGHGTRVAGVLGSETYGIAKNVSLHSVRIFDCEGGSAASTIIAAMDWIAANHTKPAIANMSFSTSSSEAHTRALENLIDSGVSVFTGAGNDPVDICNKAPASYPQVIVVASTNESDEKRPNSGLGPCVDLFAPGERIITTGHNSDTAAYVANGSSFAGPHAAGVAALFLQENPDAGTDRVADFLISNAIEDVVRNAGEGSPNRFIYSRFESSVESNTALNRNDWVISASNRSSQTGRAVDGNDETRWSTGQSQRENQWIEIDLSASETFNRIVLDTEGSSQDFPREYTVRVSANGNQWETVASGAGGSAVTSINFDEQNAQYVRIEQSGNTDRWWWSIHELNLYR